MSNRAGADGAPNVMGKEISRLFVMYFFVFVSFVGPILGVALAAYYISFGQEQERAESAAAEILRRAERVSEQMRTSFEVI